MLFRSCLCDMDCIRRIAVNLIRSIPGSSVSEKLVAVLKNSIDVMEKQQNKMKSRVVMPLFFIAFLRGKFCDILVTVMFYSGYIMIMSKN